jgi:hypothetical protein
MPDTSNSEQPQAFCANHPDEPAQSVCKKCGTPLCYDCRYYSYGKWYCEACFTRLRANAHRRNGWVVFFACHIILTASTMGALTAIGYGRRLFVWYAVNNSLEAWAQIAVWHVFDAALVFGAVSALLLKRWAGRTLRYACFASAARALLWLGVTVFGPGAGADAPIAYFYAALLAYSLIGLGFFSSKIARDEFRAIRP